MRISDWSSDVCSSDLKAPLATRSRCAIMHAIAGSLRSASRAWIAMHSARSRAPTPEGLKPWTRASTASTSPSGTDRKCVGQGNSVSVRVDPGDRLIIKKNLRYKHTYSPDRQLTSLVKSTQSANNRDHAVGG